MDVCSAGGHFDNTIAMETVKCPCGQAEMTYEVIGEDMWMGTAVNTRIVYNDNYGKDCICRSCGVKYDEFDPCMVTVTPESMIR